MAVVKNLNKKQREFLTGLRNFLNEAIKKETWSFVNVCFTLMHDLTLGKKGIPRTKRFQR